jgi:hypothetical protein
MKEQRIVSKTKKNYETKQGTARKNKTTMKKQGK